jgi:hypothetical protein
MEDTHDWKRLRDLIIKSNILHCQIAKKPLKQISAI